MGRMDNIELPLLPEFLAQLEKLGRVRLDRVRAEVPYFNGHRSANMDAVVDLVLMDGDEIRLVCEILMNAHPKKVWQGIKNMQAFSESKQSSNYIPCIIADELSSASKELLETEGVSYYEASGSMRFDHPRLVVHRDMPALPKSRSKRGTNLFSDAREQVIHALLMHWISNPDNNDPYLSGAEMVTLSGTSTFTVSSTMQELEQLEWVVSKGSGPALRRKLINPAALLDAWEDVWTKRREVTCGWYAYSHDANLVPMVRSKFGKLRDSVQWAVTGTQAANIRAPLLTNVDRVKVAVPVGMAQEIGRELDLKPTDKAPNIVLVERKASSFQFTEIGENVRITSPFIQYLDLLDGHGRNAELASHYRKTVLNLPHR